jgi:TetR/AcrR family transcriptional regulator, transcriptional repressor for nem operon
MTASVTSERPGKRDRLVAGAREAIHRQGAEATTLADIAEASGVGLGNVYYYFKSKHELVAAVIESYAQESRERLSRLEQQHRTPRARLKALVRLLVSQPDQVALYGCPGGSLCSELGKHDNDLARACKELMDTPVAWIEQQFKAMGRRDARDLAFALLASYEGIALLANTFRDPELMAREGRRLERWIDSLAGDSKVALTGESSRKAAAVAVIKTDPASAPRADRR